MDGGFDLGSNGLSRSSNGSRATEIGIGRSTFQPAWISSKAFGTRDTQVLSEVPGRAGVQLGTGLLDDYLPMPLNITTSDRVPTRAKANRVPSVDHA